MYNSAGTTFAVAGFVTKIVNVHRTFSRTHLCFCPCRELDNLSALRQTTAGATTEARAECRPCWGYLGDAGRWARLTDTSAPAPTGGPADQRTVGQRTSGPTVAVSEERRPGAPAETAAATRVPPPGAESAALASAGRNGAASRPRLGPGSAPARPGPGSAPAPARPRPRVGPGPHSGGGSCARQVAVLGHCIPPALSVLHRRLEYVLQ